MIYLPQLLTLAGIMLLACVSPGPDFVAVSSHALASRRAGVQVALGVAVGCVVWALMAVFGLGLLIAELGWLYSTLRLVGAAYLLYLGAKMLTSARHASPPLALERADEDGRGGFRRGLFINLANPKAAVFFSSLFVTVLPVGAPLWVHVATVAIVAGVAFFWFVALALMFSAGRVRHVYGRLRRGVDALMGAALLGLGAKLALER